MNIFDSIAETLNLPPEAAAKVSSDLTGVILLTLAGASDAKMDETSKTRLGELIKNNKTVEALGFIRASYPGVEWEELLKSEVQPLIEDYVSTVLA